jgi:nicotinamidase-related amidase
VRIPIDTVLLAFGSGRPAPPHEQDQEPGPESRAGALLAVWRRCGMPVLHVLHDGAAPLPHQREGFTAFADAGVLGPSRGDAFAGADLEERLEAGGHTTLVMCGTGPDDAVAATALGAAARGFRVFVVADACWAAGRAASAGTSAPVRMQPPALPELHGAHAAIVDARTACEAAAAIASRRK